jgi:RNA polymerase sigma-70 factor (ECF subfamily)
MNELPGLPVDSLRRLARGLLYDRDRAADVVQEAWLAALRSRTAPESLRGWLIEAVRRIARSTDRDELRRAAREERAARPEALPSAEETSARIEVLRHLLDAVDALDEPYRTAIVLRYFDELPPRAIAARLGVPVNTVRTHVRRGLERLRRELDGEHGRGREAFLAACVPLAGELPWREALGLPTLPSLAPIQSGILIAKSLSSIAMLLVLAAGAAWLLSEGSNENEDGVRTATSTVLPAPASSAQKRSLGSLDPFGSAQDTREAAGSNAQAVGDSWTVRGHVFRGRREPYAGARIAGRVYRGGKPEGTPLLDERFGWTMVEIPAEGEIEAHIVIEPRN